MHQACFNKYSQGEFDMAFAKKKSEESSNFMFHRNNLTEYVWPYSNGIAFRDIIFRTQLNG